MEPKSVEDGTTGQHYPRQAKSTPGNVEEALDASPKTVRTHVNRRKGGRDSLHVPTAPSQSKVEADNAVSGLRPKMQRKSFETFADDTLSRLSFAAL